MVQRAWNVQQGKLRVEIENSRGVVVLQAGGGAGMALQRGAETGDSSETAWHGVVLYKGRFYLYGFVATLPPQIMVTPPKDACTLGKAYMTRVRVVLIFEGNFDHR